MTCRLALQIKSSALLLPPSTTPNKCRTAKNTFSQSQSDFCIMYRTIQPNLCRLSRISGTFRQISTRFRSMGKIINNGSDKDSGRGSSPSPSSSSSILFGRAPGTCSPSNTERKEQGKYSARATPMKSNSKEYSSHTTVIGLNSKHGYFNKRRTRVDLGSEEMARDINLSQIDILPLANLTSDQDIFSLPSQFGKKSMSFHGKRSKSCQSNFKCAYTEGLPKVTPFDICFPLSRDPGFSEASSPGEDEENWYNVDHNIQGTRQRVLRPGMVLLKHYITHDHQVKIVKTCRELGLGPGGFYRPGYQDGAKLRLQMMCLGMNWDPQTRKYEDQRSVDGCRPPGIPCEFKLLVKKAIKDAHALIRTDCKLSNVEDMLPAMSPDICIVNFYTTSGRLGLHKDRDESAESLRKGLPVVSFSVGDSAEFLYGDQRDVNKAEKVVLESGDILIFGGKSRHIFHGVTSIIPNSSPKALLNETGLCPGRVNLTFRQF